MFDAPGEAHHRGTGSGLSPLLQGFETTSPARQVRAGHRTNGVLGPSGNPESLFAHPLQVTLLSTGFDPSRPRERKLKLLLSTF